ncbi:MAG TPA: AAA family ATPase, partial [Planctomycetota bacterium]|nr:AAA family ATPase [Planctomycetota bacterium]
MEIKIPDFSLVAMVGVSGSGKSTFASRHFAATEVLSSDAFRALVSADANSQSATPDAFDALYHVAGIRLRNRRLTVIDATNTQKEARSALLDLASRYHVLPVAIVLALPTKVCIERNRTREGRGFSQHVIPQQAGQLRRSLRGLRREGFRHVYVLETPEEVEGVVVQRVPLWTDKRSLQGPFDIIGDIHGCFDELQALLKELGYGIERTTTEGRDHFHVTPPDGRSVVFLGDLVDRGPRVADVLRLVMDMVGAGTAICVPGNHEIKLARKLHGKDVRIAHGLAETLEQLELVPGLAEEARAFIDKLVSHYVLDDGRLVVAHAGMTEELQGRASGVVRSFALYGDTTGEIDDYGLPVRHEWARENRGSAMVVYGHT